MKILEKFIVVGLFGGWLVSGLIRCLLQERFEPTVDTFASISSVLYTKKRYPGIPGDPRTIDQRNNTRAFDECFFFFLSTVSNLKKSPFPCALRDEGGFPPHGKGEYHRASCTNTDRKEVESAVSRVGERKNRQSFVKVRHPFPF